MNNLIYLYPEKNAEIFCVHCGVELRPKGIERCPDCYGALYETCEIVFDFIFSETYGFVFYGHFYKGRCLSDIPTFKFLAQVTEGPYVTAGVLCCVGELPCFDATKDGPESENQEHINAVEDLSKKLREDGWHPLSNGAQWYSRRFRRRVW